MFSLRNKKKSSLALMRGHNKFAHKDVRKVITFVVLDSSNEG